MLGKYCSAEPKTSAPVDDENTCDLDEINTARQWM